MWKGSVWARLASAGKFNFHHFFPYADPIPSGSIYLLVLIGFKGLARTFLRAGHEALNMLCNVFRDPVVYQSYIPRKFVYIICETISYSCSQYRVFCIGHIQHPPHPQDAERPCVLLIPHPFQRESEGNYGFDV